MPELTLDTGLRVSPDAAFRELDGEGVLLDLGSGRYFGLDPVALRTWQMLSDGLTLRAIRDRLLDEFDVDAPTLESDLLTFVRDLLGRGLVSTGTI
ncbi:MAG: hypothetical protein A3H96_24390 [Acidobacteria bacterium RIFCSPLOWO2_02_FULL_67_36]|nr:MAG: hypothetical protein A3H96_24390 [Acidobacteria bacterium RIFCSPLOWO2_02_FULL_67_36]OFW19159.1 MAG: hypothetical protein A3G21_04640 [Acidobacteria bacterium RIFCSPLOWO2_12_FULL_66_21]